MRTHYTRHYYCNSDPDELRAAEMRCNFEHWVDGVWMPLVEYADRYRVPGHKCIDIAPEYLPKLIASGLVRVHQRTYDLTRFYAERS